jgi:hypothetical protein
MKESKLSNENIKEHYATLEVVIRTSEEKSSSEEEIRIGVFVCE